MWCDMAVSEKSDWCLRCGKERLFRRHEPEHWLHLVLTAITGGWWLLVWIVAIVFRGPFRCVRCGHTHQVSKAHRSVWLLPSVGLALVLFIFGIGAGRFLSRHEPRSKPSLPSSSMPSAHRTNGDSLVMPPDFDATTLLRIFQENPRQAEARFSEQRLTISGKVRYVPPSRPGNHAWLVFVDATDEPIAQCLIPEDAQERFGARFGEIPTPATLRCDLLRYSPDGSLTFHRPELVVE